MSIKGLTDTQTAWLKLLTLVIGSGSAVTVTSFLGGAKLWIAILCGLGTGMTNVYHALADSPQDAQPKGQP
jgi:pantothenate kinase type III